MLTLRSGFIRVLKRSNLFQIRPVHFLLNRARCAGFLEIGSNPKSSFDIQQILRHSVSPSSNGMASVTEQSNKTTALHKVSEIRKLFDDTRMCPQRIDAYVIPHEDPHMSEYVADVDKRIEYLSGFTGSAGINVVTRDAAHLWTDGRYYIQAENELKEPFVLKKILGGSGHVDWLTKNMPCGSYVGGDPLLFSFADWDKLVTGLGKLDINVVPVETNLVDAIWSDKYERIHKEVMCLPLSIAGETIESKVHRVLKQMQAHYCDLYIVSELDNVAWLLNMRGTDIDYNPLFWCYVLIQGNEQGTSVMIFMQRGEPTKIVQDHINGQCGRLTVTFHPYDEVFNHLNKLLPSFNRVFIPSSCNQKLCSLIPESKRFSDFSIVTKLKAFKNQTEVHGMRNSHIRDGYALCRYLMWLEEQIKNNAEVTEISGADQLERYRSEENDFKGLSFPTISSVGAHAAIIHYQPKPDTDVKITKSEIYLVDSGGQYRDGTTDVTRTIHLGEPTQIQKEIFTRVLKGVISLNTAIFPTDVKGNMLDSFARRALWDYGLDYGHGTGHGVGAYLCVHEGPIGISFRQMPADCGLRENIFVSNEPGCYIENQFGFRIENVEVIVPAKKFHNGYPGYQQFMPDYEPTSPFLTFETVTMCPIQKKLIEVSILTEKELKWVNDYHQVVRENLTRHNDSKPQRDVKFHAWIIQQTEPIVR